MTDSPNGRVIREAVSFDDDVLPIVDAPSTDDIVLSGDTLELAKAMTQQERDALLIMVMRNTQEIVGFVRDAQRAMDAMQSAPGMMGTMMRGMMPGLGNGGSNAG